MNEAKPGALPGLRETAYPHRRARPTTENLMTAETKAVTYRVITLTGRPPVRIRDDQWPVIALAHDKEFDSLYESQANRTTEISIRVRRHADGRAIVYARYSYDSAWQHERDELVRVGMLVVADGDLPVAIRQIGARLRERDVPEGLVQEMVDACIADLPPENLDEPASLQTEATPGVQVSVVSALLDRVAAHVLNSITREELETIWAEVQVHGAKPAAIRQP